MAYITAEPDDSRSIGHARIVIDWLDQPLADPGFRIVREGYPTPNLGRRGWQVGEERLKPVAVTTEAGRVVLIVGPAVTMHLLVEPYLFTMPAAGIEAALFWPDSIDVFDGPIPDAVDIPPDEPAPKPAPRPEPEATVIIRHPMPAPEPVAAPAPIITPPPPPPPGPKPNGGGSKMPLILGGVLVLLLAAGGATWWVLNQPPPPTPVPAPPPTPVVTPTPVPTPVPVPVPAPPPAPVWPDGTDALSLADVVGRAPNPAGVHAVALRRQAEGKHDDALVLFEEAAARGNGPSMTAVARMYDPNGFVLGRPFRNPDPRAAAQYYRDATRAGDAAAEAPRAALRATLEAQAAAGDANAPSYLQEFWP